MGGGLIWRAADDRNYYLTRANPLEQNIRIYRVVKGVRQLLKNFDHIIDVRQWHQLRVTMVGCRVQVFFDKSKVFDLCDKTFGEGRIGHWTKSDATTYFDNLKLETDGTWRPYGTLDATNKEFFVMASLVVVAIVAFGCFSLWDAGYLGSYWEQWERGDNIKCFDAQGEFTTSGQQTCFVLTQRGLNARERLTEACEARGEKSETCFERAIKQLAASLPGETMR